jgi:hypothetical protein
MVCFLFNVTPDLCKVLLFQIKKAIPEEWLFLI